MSVQKKAIHNTVSSLSYYCTILIFGLILPRLYMQSYGSATSGLDSAVRQIFSCLSLLEAGVGLASQQAYYKPVAEDDKDKINAILAATAGYYKKTGIIYGAVTLFLCFVYPLCIKSELPYITIFLIILMYGIPGVVSYLVQGKYRSFLDASGDTYVVTYVITGSTIAGNLLRMAALLRFNNILLVQATYLAPTAIQLVCILAYIRRNYPWLTANVTPDSSALGQKSAVLVHQIAETIFSNTDTILISTVCSLIAANVYAVYAVFFSNLQKIFDSVVISISFKLGQLFNTDRKSFGEIFGIYVALVYTAAFACFTAVALFIVPVVGAYTSGITDANYIRRDVAILFTIVSILSCIKRPWTNIITYSGKFKETQHQAITETVLNVGISIPAAYFFGLSGALAGTIIALTYRIIATTLYVYREIFHESPIKNFMILGINFVSFAAVIKLVGLTSCDGKGIIAVLLTGCWYGVANLLVFAAVNAIANKKTAQKLIGYIGG